MSFTCSVEGVVHTHPKYGGIIKTHEIHKKINKDDVIKLNMIVSNTVLFMKGVCFTLLDPKLSTYMYISVNF